MNGITTMNARYARLSTISVLSNFASPPKKRWWTSHRRPTTAKPGELQRLLLAIVAGPGIERVAHGDPYMKRAGRTGLTSPPIPP